jgi:hypothetical protein
VSGTRKNVSGKRGVTLSAVEESVTLSAVEESVALSTVEENVTLSEARGPKLCRHFDHYMCSEHVSRSTRMNSARTSGVAPSLRSG